MVMSDQPQPRRTFVLLRGEYNRHGEQVFAATPAILAIDDRTDHRNATANRTRLDLARWLVHPSHPLTARVIVNRLWQQCFGSGIVRTVDDFGTQGEWPSHPELLDWLAIELIDSGWDIQHVLKLIVTSSTYRQTSDAAPHDIANDPDNRHLSRGPRFRMKAEMIRDAALAISGLLVEKRGGPSVKPYQPDGLWEDVTYDSDTAYLLTRGDDNYRRSLYTFWKRQAPPPNMLIFDAPTRETCIVQRSRTNTPLQALVLMNDPTFLEAARRLAERTLSVATASSDRIDVLFRSATARHPNRLEVRSLETLLRQQHAAFQRNPADAAELLNIGQSDYDTALNATELAAWTTVASIILCLDETITRR